MLFRSNLKNQQYQSGEELLSVFLDKGVVRYSSTSQKQVHKPSEDLSKYQLVEPNDFVLNNQQAWRGSVGISNYRGIISPAYYVLTPKRNLNPTFMNYMLRDRAVIDQFVLSSKGVGSIQRQIYVPQMKRTVLAIPPRLEQDQIARFLSWKTSEMMHFIKEKMIEIIRLRELKKALIDRTVLRGIENDVQIKNTGIEWIQHIPVHWKLRKVRELFIERREKVSDKEYIPLSVCKAGIVPRLESAVQTDNGDNRKLVITGDFVINSRSDRKGSSGISPLNGSVSLINIVLKPITNENPQYLHYLLRSTSFTEEFYRNGRGLVSDLWTDRKSVV